MELSEEMCNSLIKWLRSLELQSKDNHLGELSDGILMAQVLVQIAPDYFIRLNAIIHIDVGSNWRLKVNNLKKIMKCLEEYYQDVLNLHFLEAAKPDLSKIGEFNDYREIGKILRLILGCAVNCEEKQEYITRIMLLEESVQQNIMQAIQQLEDITHGRGRSSLSLLGFESDSRLQRLMVDLELANETKDMLSQKCHNLETKVVCLSEEKSTLFTENNQLLKKLKDIETNFSREAPDGKARNTEMRKQIEALEEHLLKMETQRDDYRIKVLDQEKDIQMLQDNIIDLQAAAEKSAQLKDEVDALTETAEKAKILETTLISYKKKLEEHADLKKKYKIMEDENNEYYKQNIKYEEEVKRNNIYKSQLEIYKKKVSDLHQNLEDELRKFDKLNFDYKKLESKLLVVQREKESLIEERNNLKEINEELRCQYQRQSLDEPNAVACELAPTELQLRIKYLEKENQYLRSSAEDTAATQLLLEDVQNRLEKSLDQNRTYNHKILELEAQLEEGSKVTSESTNTDQDELLLYKNKCITLQNTVANKETEMLKCLEKARDVMKQVEPRSGRFIGKSMKFDNLGEDRQRQQEERLITSSFHRLAMNCQREAVDERFALLTHGQSFLSRQRHSMSRKPIQPYRSK